jgi:hypothetical protein
METLSEPVIGVGDVTLPGIITLGDIIVDAANMTGTIQGGVPYAGKPYSLSGFYKFFPAVQDSAVIGMALYRWNGQSRDTLAIGYFYTGDVAAQWTEFEAVLNYDIYEESDTMNIVASSTAVYAQNLPVGSVLYLDNLALNYGPISVLQPEFSESFIVIPEVWASRIRIETDDTGVPQQADIRLYDLSGQLVAKEKQWSSNGVFYINYRSLNPGIYIIGLITTDGRSFHQKVRIY